MQLRKKKKCGCNEILTCAFVSSQLEFENFFTASRLVAVNQTGQSRGQKQPSHLFPELPPFPCRGDVQNQVPSLLSFFLTSLYSSGEPWFQRKKRKKKEIRSAMTNVRQLTFQLLTEWFSFLTRLKTCSFCFRDHAICRCMSHEDIGRHS